MYEIPAKIMRIKKFRLYCMKRAPNGGESAVTEHFFMQIGRNMAPEHETRQIAASPGNVCFKKLSCPAFSLRSSLLPLFAVSCFCS